LLLQQPAVVDFCCLFRISDFDPSTTTTTAMNRSLVPAHLPSVQPLAQQVEHFLQSIQVKDVEKIAEAFNTEKEGKVLTIVAGKITMSDHVLVTDSSDAVHDRTLPISDEGASESTKGSQ
jgi:hypothetical protein